MMVIRGNLSQSESRQVFDDAGLSAQTGVIFPADRCVFTIVTNASGGYTISQAAFHGFSDPGTTNRDRAYSIANPELGFIGKSGRFVQIAE